jgi:hypothetical protein
LTARRRRWSSIGTTSHDNLDCDADLFAEIRSAMRVLVERVAQLRAGVRLIGVVEEPRRK